MKIINIPSVKSERCNAILKFHEKKYEVVAWEGEVECYTPALSGKIRINLESDYLKSFINDLKIIERDRKGECSLGYQRESGFSLIIRSIDSVGHFEVNILLEDSRNSRGFDSIDTLKISYEIEPSLLSTLLKDFTNL